MKLLVKYATPKLVLRFAEMVQLLGPQPRLVNFFQSICTVEGAAVKANQEMVLRLTWMTPEKRQKLFLELVPKEVSDLPVQEGDDFGKVRLPSGVMTDGKLKKSAMENHPKDYIGKDTYEREGSFAPVYVKWLGSPNWKPGTSKEGGAAAGDAGAVLDELFWDAQSMGIKKVREKDGAVLVRVEHLCWVLNGPLLCEAVTGKHWEVYCFERDADVTGDLAAKFKRQHQLASYFVGQLQLHRAMCEGRSYNCIEWLQQSSRRTGRR